ncbi:hypothetical protein ACFX2A_024985 [Malus domestica]
MAASADNFYQDFDVTFGNGRAKILNGGQLLTLNLDQASGSGFKSKNEYLFGRIDMQINLVAGNSAGTVTAYYLSSEGPLMMKSTLSFWETYPEIPTHYIPMCSAKEKATENSSSTFGLIPQRPSTPTPLFGTRNTLYFWKITCQSECSTTWNQLESHSPKNKPMRIYSSLWNADDWATRGGLVKTDWTQAPFTASYRNFKANACTSGSSSSCASTASTNSVGDSAWQTQGLDAAGRNRLRWVQQKFMVYNYCNDLKRFPQGLPAECRRSRF